MNGYVYLILNCIYRERVHEGVLRLCKEAMMFKTAQRNWDWLFVLPLCHFLSGACDPFASLNLNPTLRDFTSRAQDYSYNELRKKNLQGYCLFSSSLCIIILLQACGDALFIFRTIFCC